MLPTVTEATAQPRRRSLRVGSRTAGLVLLASLAGLGVGRFVGFDGGGSRPATVTASTPASEIRSLEQAIIERPSDPVAWQSLGSAYVRFAIATGDPDYFSGAERALAQATELDPASPVTLAARGTFALTLHQFEEALRLGERAEALDPFNPEARAVRVDALVELGRYEEAAVALQGLLDLRPGLAAHTRVSYLRQLAGDLDGALAAMQEAQAAAGDSGFEAATANALRGEIHLLRGEVDRAGEAFDVALRQAPGHVAGELGRARHLELTGKRSEAIVTLRQALGASGAPALATLLGELLDADGRRDEAQRSFDVARQVYREEVDAGAVVDLEVAYLEADHGSVAVAVDSARRAYDARPNIYTSDALGWALYRKGDAAAAVPYAEEALGRGTKDPALRVHAALILQAAGRADEAKEALAPAITLGGYLPLPLRPLAAPVVQDLGLSLPSSWRP